MDWFRMYGEFLNDPKVQMLSELNQRRFIMLLCIRCSNGDVTLHDDEVAFQLRISNEEYAQTKEVLLSKNLIHEDNKPTNWSKRQYVSDSSTERVSRHREKKKQACNVTETKCNAIDTDTDTDTDTDKKQTTSASAPKFDFAKSLSELGVERKSILAWLAVRKSKKATNTEIALDGFVREAGKAGLSVPDAVLICIERSWSGLNAEWLKPKAQASPNYESSRDRDRRETLEALTGKKKNEQRSENIIDIN